MIELTKLKNPGSYNQDTWHEYSLQSFDAF